MPLRLAFMGTPEFSVPALKSLIAAGHDVACVYTQPPRPKGRGQHLTISPVHECALAHNIPVRHPASLRKSPEAQAEFAALNLDIAIVAAYGLLLPQAVLDAPKYGCLNIHASLLPRWRGASPIQHAVWYGDVESGVTIMQMEAGLDTGPMILKGVVPITATTTAASLQDQLSIMGAELTAQVLADLERTGKIISTVQPDDGMTYAPLLKKEDGRIDWAKTASAIDCQIRAFTPWPGTYVMLGEQTCKIITGVPRPDTTTAAPGTVLNRDGDIACGGGTVLRVTLAQAPSGKKMDMAAFINGGYATIGQIFGS